MFYELSLLFFLVLSSLGWNCWVDMQNLGFVLSVGFIAGRFAQLQLRIVNVRSRLLLPYFTVICQLMFVVVSLKVFIQFVVGVSIF
jgi:hypothetical protein